MSLSLCRMSNLRNANSALLILGVKGHTTGRLPPLGAGNLPGLVAEIPAEDYWFVGDRGRRGWCEGMSGNQPPTSSTATVNPSINLAIILAIPHLLTGSGDIWLPLKCP